MPQEDAEQSSKEMTSPDDQSHAEMLLAFSVSSPKKRKRTPDPARNNTSQDDHTKTKTASSSSATSSTSSLKMPAPVRRKINATVTANKITMRAVAPTASLLLSNDLKVSSSASEQITLQPRQPKPPQDKSSQPQPQSHPQSHPQSLLIKAPQAKLSHTKPSQSHPQPLRISKERPVPSNGALNSATQNSTSKPMPLATEKKKRPKKKIIVAKTWDSDSSDDSCDEYLPVPNRQPPPSNFVSEILVQQLANGGQKITIDGHVVDRNYVQFKIDACHSFIAIIVEKFKCGKIEHLGKYLMAAHKELIQLGTLINMECLRGVRREHLDTPFTKLRELEKRTNKKDEEAKTKMAAAAVKDSSSSSSSSSST